MLAKKIETSPKKNGYLMEKSSKVIQMKNTTSKINNSSSHLINSFSVLNENSDEELDETNNNSDKMKTKLLSMWNSVKYGWTIRLKVNFNLDNPIWLLGVCYCKINKNSLNYLQENNLKYESQLSNQIVNENLKVNFEKSKSNKHLVRANSLVDTNNENSSVSYYCSISLSNSNLYSKSSLISSANSVEVLESFKHDYYSRIWMTYRREFKKICGSQFTTDCGWGCMLRSGQMMLAQAFLCHYLQRSWRWTGAKSDKEDMIHRMLIKWFADSVNEMQCPFSIHQLVKCGFNLGKKPGDWYGPSSVAYILKKALEEAKNESNLILDDICIYIAQDCTVYLNDLMDLCTLKEQPFKYKSLSALKKEKKNYNNHTINGSFTNSKFINTRKRIRSSLKSLGSSVDLAALKFNDLKSSKNIETKDLHKKNSSSSGESNINSQTNSINQSIDDVFDNVEIINSNNQSKEDKQEISLSSSNSSNYSNSLNSSNLSNSSKASTFTNKSKNNSHNNASPKKRSFASSTKLSNSKPKSKKWKGVIIFIPLRLGGSKFNSIYTDCIKKLFCTPYCIGIIGGKPKHSLYFIGCQEDKMIYLDPHYCQETVDVINNTNFSLNSYHCSTPRKLPINRMDPSCTIGFYCKSKKDLNNLMEFTRKEMIPSGQRKKNRVQYPIFLFEEGSSMNSFQANSFNNNNLNKNHNVNTNLNNKQCVTERISTENNGIEENDFVMI